MGLTSIRITLFFSALQWPVPGRLRQPRNPDYGIESDRQSPAD